MVENNKEPYKEQFYITKHNLTLFPYFLCIIINKTYAAKNPCFSIGPFQTILYRQNILSFGMTEEYNYPNYRVAFLPTANNCYKDRKNTVFVYEIA